MTTKSRQVPISVVMVSPEMGLFDEPIMPTPGEVDDPAGGDRAGADVADIAAPDGPGVHLRDRHLAGKDRRRHARADELHERDEHGPRQEAAGDEDARAAKADDVADAEQLG